MQSTVVYLLWSALAGLLFASLAATRLHRLQGVTLAVDAPRRVTLRDPITFSVVARNEGPRDRDVVRFHGPFLPWDGTWVGPPPRALPLLSGAVARADLVARFSARGEHHLDPFSATEMVPLGLEQGPPASSPGVKFLVVPRIARVVRLSTPPGARYQPGGVALASRTGESMDLLGVRPYRTGDPVRLLHANLVAQAVQPYLGAPIQRAAPGRGKRPFARPAISRARGVLSPTPNSGNEPTSSASAYRSGPGLGRAERGLGAESPRARGAWPLNRRARTCPPCTSRPGRLPLRRGNWRQALAHGISSISSPDRVRYTPRCLQRPSRDDPE